MPLSSDPNQPGRVVAWQPAEILSGATTPVPCERSADQGVAGMQPLFSGESHLREEQAAAFVPLVGSELPSAWPALQTAVDVRPSSALGEAAGLWLPPELSPDPLGPGNPAQSMFSSHNSLLGQSQRLLQEAQARAEAILQDALARADEIIYRAEGQASQITQQAYAQAAEIAQRARQEGLEAARAETAELLQVAAAVVEQVKAWRDDLFSQGEMMMLRLVIEIAQTLFGDGLPLDAEVLGQAFSRALAEAKTLGDLRVYVHPQDAALLGPHWVQQQTVLSGQRIELVPSEVIKRGGCYVEGQFGSVDARVETQFQLIKDALLGKSADKGGEET